jgi:hypothetical protein
MPDPLCRALAGATGSALRPDNPVFANARFCSPVGGTLGAVPGERLTFYILVSIFLLPLVLVMTLLPGNCPASRVI